MKHLLAAAHTRFSAFSRRAPLALAVLALAPSLALAGHGHGGHGHGGHGGHLGSSRHGTAGWVQPQAGPYAGWGHGRPLVLAPCAPRPVAVAPLPARGRWELVWVPAVIEIRIDWFGRRSECVREPGHWQKVWRPAGVCR